MPRNSTAAPFSGDSTSGSTESAPIGSDVIHVRTSATGHRGQKCELVAVIQDVVEIGIFAIDCNDWLGRNSGCRYAQHTHGVSRGRRRRQVERQLAGSSDITVGSK